MNADKGTKGGQSVPLDIRPLAPGDWPIIVKLFGDNGACGGCWCMWPRVPRGGKLWDDLKGAKNRDCFRRLVRAGYRRPEGRPRTRGTTPHSGRQAPAGMD